MPDAPATRAKQSAKAPPPKPAAHLQHITDALVAALSKRIDSPNGQHAGSLLDQHLHLNVLQNYRAQLADLNDADALAWLVRHMAELEARITLLQSAHAAQAAGIAVSAAEMLQPAEDALFEPRSATLPFDRDVVQTGFYDLEHSPTGVGFRWIGPTPRASVFVPKVKLPAKITVWVQSAFVPDALADIKLALDGGPPAAVTVAPNQAVEGGYILTSLPEAGTLRHAATLRLDIDAIRTDTPLARGGTDDRHLAIAISCVELSSL